MGAGKVEHDGELFGDAVRFADNVEGVLERCNRGPWLVGGELGSTEALPGFELHERVARQRGDTNGCAGARSGFLGAAELGEDF